MKTKTTKELKKEITEDLYIYTELDTILTGSLDTVAANILALKDRLKAENGLVKVDPDRYLRFEMSIVTAFESMPEIKLRGIRMETDEEFLKRITLDEKARQAQKISSKKRKEIQEKKDLAMLSKLMLKYGKKK